MLSFQEKDNKKGSRTIFIADQEVTVRLMLFRCCCSSLGSLHPISELMRHDKSLTSPEREHIKFRPVSACDYWSNSGPYRTGLVWATRAHHGRDHGGVGVVRGSHIDSDSCRKMYVVATQKIKSHLSVGCFQCWAPTDRFYRLYGCKTDRYLPSSFRNSLNVGREMNVWDSEWVGSSTQALSLGWQDFIQRMVSESWILCGLKMGIIRHMVHMTSDI